MPGTLAKTTSPREVGRAAGALSLAMNAIDPTPGRKGPIAPYYELYDVHHGIGGDRDVFWAEVSQPQFDGCREAMNTLCGALEKLERDVLGPAATGDLILPKQLIHGDLHFDNVLVDGEEVSGLLDFEFCAVDWRVMELAVCLSKYVSEEGALDLCADFIAGFMEKGELTQEEMRVVPDCINLRICSNVVYFTGRALVGEDSLDSLTSRAGTYAKRVDWVEENRDALVACLEAAAAK